MNKIPTRQLGRGGPHVSAIGLGAMGIDAWYGKTDERAVFGVLTYAAGRGMTFWDTADIYGDPEQVIGRWFKETGRRSEIFLATKFGTYDPDKPFVGLAPVSTPSYIKRALTCSLAHLDTSYVDLYYQHRVGPNVPIEVVPEALRQPLEDGTIRWLGLSECSAAELCRARAVPGIGKRVIAYQAEFSPFELHIERGGFAKAAEEEGVTIVAYSLLGHGLITRRYCSRADFEEGDLRLMLPRFAEANFAKNPEPVDKVKLIAEKYNSTPSQIALAWILAEHLNFIPIPSCRSVSRVESEDIRLIRTIVEAADVRGERRPPQHVAMEDSIPLEGRV